MAARRPRRVVDGEQPLFDFDAVDVVADDSRRPPALMPEPVYEPFVRMAPGIVSGGRRITAVDPSLPAPTVMAEGIGDAARDASGNASPSRVSVADPAAPRYRVPPMGEIAAVAPNGLTMVSTFSGCGGTCLGFRMAGWRVAWANDSDANARACYALNFPGTICDGRDLRAVTAADILSATGLARGELDLFEGSPPCTVFSTAGRRSAKWGGARRHAGVADVRVEDLFFVWLDLLDGLRPRAFVAENVSGLIKGVARGYFKRIMSRMREIGYRVDARVLDAADYGVPQRRVRVIFMGVRADVGARPTWPLALGYRYSVRDALPWIDRIEGHHYGQVDRSADKTSMAIVSDSKQQRLVARVIHDTGGFVRGRDVTDSPCPPILVGSAICSTHYLVENGPPAGDETRTGRRLEQPLTNRSFDDVVFGGLDHSAATILGSAEKHSGFMREMDADGREIVRRKFSIAELRRICGFPDDFALVGTYAQQWARLGNSVPPVMAAAYAATLRDALLGARRG